MKVSAKKIFFRVRLSRNLVEFVGCCQSEHFCANWKMCPLIPRYKLGGDSHIRKAPFHPVLFLPHLLVTFLSVSTSLERKKRCLCLLQDTPAVIRTDILAWENFGWVESFGGATKKFTNVGTAKNETRHRCKLSSKPETVSRFLFKTLTQVETVFLR